MDWITDKIAISNHVQAQDAALLEQHAIRSILSLDGTLAAGQAAAFGLAEIATYRLIDGAGNDPGVFRYAVEDLSRLVRLHPPVLVQCHAGRSRSVIVVAAYLMLADNLDPDDALAAVAAKRETSVTPALMELLYKFET